MTRTVTKLLALSATAAGALLGLPVVVIAATETPAMHEASATALEEIPSAYRGLYRQAAASRCPRLPWSVLAGVGRIESTHGTTGGARLQPDGTVSPPIIGPPLDGTPGTRRITDTDSGRWDADTTFDHAVGPMQFLPRTWTRYGLDASGDGTADPHNAADAVHTAAAYLCEHGADTPRRLRDALFAYNRSVSYVDEVLYHAARYGSPTADLVAAPLWLITAVLNNPRLTIYEAGRNDIGVGRIDGRILMILQLASERHTLTISSLRSGHSRCVGGGDYPGCRESHHWHGRGVDINVVDGQHVSARNQAARRLTLLLADLSDELRPVEIGTPWSDLEPRSIFFSDQAHAHHIHLGLESGKP